MTRRTELLVATAGIVLVLVVGTLLLVRPKQQAIAQATADRNSAVAESQALRDEVRALEALKTDAAVLRAKAELAKAEFPSTPNLPALVEALQDGLQETELIRASEIARDKGNPRFPYILKVALNLPKATAAKEGKHVNGRRQGTATDSHLAGIRMLIDESRARSSAIGKAGAGSEG